MFRLVMWILWLQFQPRSSQCLALAGQYQQSDKQSHTTICLCSNSIILFWSYKTVTHRSMCSVFSWSCIGWIWEFCILPWHFYIGKVNLNLLCWGYTFALMSELHRKCSQMACCRGSVQNSHSDKKDQAPSCFLSELWFYI